VIIHQQRSLHVSTASRTTRWPLLVLLLLLLCDLCNSHVSAASTPTFWLLLDLLPLLLLCAGCWLLHTAPSRTSTCRVDTAWVCTLSIAYTIIGTIASCQVSFLVLAKLLLLLLLLLC
jgi:hypothetical protein